MSTAIQQPPKQNMVALEHANAVRLERAEVRRHLRAQPSYAAARKAKVVLLQDPPDALHGMRVFELLKSGHRHGRAAALRLLRCAGISEMATVGGITDRQRRALIAALRGAG